MPSPCEVNSLFVFIYSELNCVPDIWSLMEWSNWLTPRNHKRRFDTIFYMVFSGEKPSIHPDGIEVTNSAVSQSCTVATLDYHVVTTTL